MIIFYVIFYIKEDDWDPGIEKSEKILKIRSAPVGVPVRRGTKRKKSAWEALNSGAVVAKL